MVLLVKDVNGTERALNLAKENWTVQTIENDDSKVIIFVEPDIEITMERVQYDQVKRKLVDSGDVMDFTA